MTGGVVSTVRYLPPSPSPATPPARPTGSQRCPAALCCLCAWECVAPPSLPADPGLLHRYTHRYHTHTHTQSHTHTDIIVCAELVCVTTLFYICFEFFFTFYARTTFSLLLSSWHLLRVSRGVFTLSPLSA